MPKSETTVTLPGVPSPRDYRENPLQCPIPETAVRLLECPTPETTAILPTALSTGQAVGFPPSARWRESLQLAVVAKTADGAASGALTSQM